MQLAETWAAGVKEHDPIAGGRHLSRESVADSCSLVWGGLQADFSNLMSREKNQVAPVMMVLHDVRGASGSRVLQG